MAAPLGTVNAAVDLLALVLPLYSLLLALPIITVFAPLFLVHYPLAYLIYCRLLFLLLVRASFILLLTTKGRARPELLRSALVKILINLRVR